MTVVVLVRFACVAADLPTVPGGDAPPPARILVLGRRGCDLTPLHARHGTRLVKRLPDLSLDVVEACRPGEECDALQRYRSHPDVELAEPDHVARAAVTPDDPAYASGLLWALHNYGQNAGVPGADLDAPAGWDCLRDAGDIIVAVIDTGVRFTHEDLAANIWTNPGEVKGNRLDDDRNGYVDDVHGINAITGSGDPMDDNGHGTHIAGIIGAVGDNGKGLAGVAWKIQIMPLKFMGSDNTGSYSDAIECIEYARKMGAKIINASWGGSEYSAILQKAIDQARANGILFVTAAGNESSDSDLHPFYPGCFDLDNIVNVTATTRCDGFAANYANYGARTVHVAAPGSEIYSSWSSSDHAYITLNGTSLAAPYVTGVLALMRARHPILTHQQMIRRLIASCDPLPSLSGRCLSGGRVNLRAALGISKMAISSLPGTRLAPVYTGGGVLRYQLSGPADQTVAIEVSNGLDVWVPVLTNTLCGDGVFYFSDPSAREYGKRFFRARLLVAP